MVEDTITTTDITLDHVPALARRLHPVDQARLIARLAPTIEQVVTVSPASEQATPPPLRGLLADLGTAPSDSDITDVQYEMWSNFPDYICGCR